MIHAAVMLAYMRCTIAGGERRAFRTRDPAKQMHRLLFAVRRDDDDDHSEAQELPASG